MCFYVNYQGFPGAEGRAVQAAAGQKLEGNRDGFWNGNQNLPKDTLLGLGS